VNNIFCLPAGLHQEFILPQHCVSSHRRDNPAPNKIRWKFERGTSFGIGIFQLPDITLQCWRHWHFRFRFKIKKAAVVHPLSTSMCRDHPSLSPTPCNSFSRDKIPRRASRDSGTIGASTKVDSVPHLFTFTSRAESRKPQCAPPAVPYYSNIDLSLSIWGLERD